MTTSPEEMLSDVGSAPSNRGGQAIEIGSDNGLETIDEGKLNSQQQESLRIARKILNVLAVYPIISPTMLQMGIGPSTRPAVWKPVLEQLIHEGFVIREHRPTKTIAGGLRVASILRLSDTSYTNPHEWVSDGLAGGESNLDDDTE